MNCRMRRFSVLCLSVLLLHVSVAVAGPIDDVVAQVSQARYTDYLNNYLYAGTGYTRQRPSAGWQGALAVWRFRRSSRTAGGASR